MSKQVFVSPMIMKDVLKVLWFVLKIMRGVLVYGAYTQSKRLSISKSHDCYLIMQFNNFAVGGANILQPSE